MNKSQLIQQVAASADMKASEAGRVVEAVFDTITQSLKSGEQVNIAGFGNFVAKKRAERDGRNPATGAAIKIPARTSATFKPASTLKDLG